MYCPGFLIKLSFYVNYLLAITRFSYIRNFSMCERLIITIFCKPKKGNTTPIDLDDIYVDRSENVCVNRSVYTQIKFHIALTNLPIFFFLIFR